MFGFGSANQKKRINDAFEANDRKRSFRSMATMKKILILFNIQDLKAIQAIAKELKQKGKDVLMWTVQPPKEEGYLISGVRVITHKEFSNRKGLSPDVIAEFNMQKYDTLMDFTTVEDDTMLYLLAINKAEFCVGIKELEHKPYDFLLVKGYGKDLLETYEQIKNYLNNVC